LKCIHDIFGWFSLFIIVIFFFKLSQLQKIIDDENEAKDGEKYLAALTAGDRVPWAQARKKFFSQGVNKSSLDAIEKVTIFSKFSQN
jgi:hypothetical protein